VSQQVGISAAEAAAAKQSFERDGFVILRNVVSPQRLAELHAALSAEFDLVRQTGGIFSGGGLMSGHLNCFPGAQSRFVLETLQQRGVIDLVRQLHPAAVRLPNVGCNFNLPGSRTQHWHTDRPFDREFIIANVAMVDHTVENGATDVIPGTHKRLYKYTEFVFGKVDRNSQRVLLNRGDVLIRSSNTWHRGMTNTTAVPRPMLAFTWEDGGSNLQDPYSLHEGRIRFLPNWFKLNALGRMRERLFVKVPLAYTTLRLARSLLDPRY
jgi:ectoine hydroxylase-related dioxygenase (phytanoyl-CoA dioxygenase family)